MRVPAALLASWRHGWRPLAVLFLCAVAALVQAQSADTDDSAPPDRVARLSYIAGDLGFLPAGSQDWASADLNRPLTTGDRLSTGDDSRAELELGGASLRMAGGTDFGLLNLNDNLAQVELTRGTLNLSVRHLDQGQSYEIDTPTLALVVSHPGTFRVDVDNGGNGTRVTVFDGQATVYGENNAQHDVFSGRSYQFDDAALASLTVSDIGGGDAFDAWCSERDQRYAQSQTRRYVSDDVVGYQDLDQYGSWQSSPDYGAVWYPSQVPVGWAPYRDGHWAYIAPWGWTWVDDSPWGFAPYHYGRWAYIGGAWGWIPGPAVVRPVYAPALVAFVGGGGWSVSIGIGGGAPVGWFPLGPGEVYNPWYHCDRDYYRRVNVTNIYVNNTTINRTTIINNINNQYNYYSQGRAPQNLRYANREAPRGFTAVSGTAFAGGQRVQRGLLHVDPRRLAAAPVLAHGVAALQPTARSVAPPRNFRGQALPTADFRRNVVARTPPPATLPMVRSASPHAIEPSARPERAPFANVRVLNGHGMPRPVAAAQAETDRAVPAQPRPLPGAEHNFRADQPRGINPPTSLPNPRRMEQAPAEAGALPSARFAHPGTGERTLPVVEPIRRAEPSRAQQSPRPGVSYIAGPEESRPQPAQHSERPADTLPQPPRIERAPQRYESVERANPPTYAPQRAESMRQPEPPRFERPDNQPRPYYQPPREYSRPAYQEQPHYEAPRPAVQAQPRNEPPPRKEPPKYKDEQH